MASTRIASLVLSVTLWLTVHMAVATDLKDVLLDRPIDLAGVHLQTTTGAGFGDKSLAGRWTFAVIGFTFCPDVCPFTLGNLAAVQAAIGKTDAPEPQFVFITVDPKRDDLDTLRGYVGHFSETFIGATGTKPAIDSFIKKAKAFYRHGPKDKDGDYAVDHSALIYLIDPKARITAKLEPPLHPKRTAEAFQRIVQRFAAQTKG